VSIYKNLKNQKGAIDLILIGVVLVLAAALGGYVYYQQQQANKSYDAAGNGATVSKNTTKKSTPKAAAQEWQTFNNDFLGYSGKAPKEWLDQDNHDATLEYHTKDFDIDETVGNITHSHHQVSSGASLNIGVESETLEYYRKRGQGGQLWPAGTKITDTKVDGIAALRADVASSTSHEYYTEVYAVKGDNAYRITLDYAKSSTAEYKTTFDSILQWFEIK
jgi:hypothetical protein